MVLIGYTIHKCNRPFGWEVRQLPQLPHHSRPSQFRSVSPAKLGPFGWFMSEPFAERRGRRQVFSPFNNASPFLADSSWLPTFIAEMTTSAE